MAYMKQSSILLGFPGSSVGKKSTCNAGDPSLSPGSGRSPGERDRLPTPVFLGFFGGSAGKESTCSVRDLGPSFVFCLVCIVHFYNNNYPSC